MVVNGTRFVGDQRFESRLLHRRVINEPQGTARPWRDTIPAQPDHLTRRDRELGGSSRPLCGADAADRGARLAGGRTQHCASSRPTLDLLDSVAIVVGLRVSILTVVKGVLSLAMLLWAATAALEQVGRNLRVDVFGQLNGKIINNAANSGALGVVGVPAPVIGRGLPVLAVDGLLFGAKLLQRSKKHGPLGTVVAQAATPIPS